MRSLSALLLSLSSCAEQVPQEQPPPVDVPIPSGPPGPQEAPPEGSASIQPGLHWETVARGEGQALRLVGPEGSLRMSIACLRNPARLVVGVPEFKPVGSEDRFMLALDDDPVTLVADPTRQTGPGVTGTGAAPEDFAERLRNAKQVGAVYGYQEIGPLIPPGERLAEALGPECAEVQ